MPLGHDLPPLKMTPARPRRRRGRNPPDVDGHASNDGRALAVSLATTGVDRTERFSAPVRPETSTTTGHTPLIRSARPQHSADRRVPPKVLTLSHTCSTDVECGLHVRRLTRSPASARWRRAPQRRDQQRRGSSECDRDLADRRVGTCTSTNVPGVPVAARSLASVPAVAGPRTSRG